MDHRNVRRGVASVLLLWCVGSLNATELTPDVGEKQLHFLYLGASYCGPCKAPEMKEAVAKARTLFEERAKAEGMSFVATGVALDPDLASGLAFLDDAGTFDQIVVGGHHGNLAMVDYVWRVPKPGPDELPNDGIPQIIVAARTARREHGRLIVSEPRVLGYAIGTIIPLWVEKVAPTLSLD